MTSPKLFLQGYDKWVAKYPWLNLEKEHRIFNIICHTMYVLIPVFNILLRHGSLVCVTAQFYNLNVLRLNGSKAINSLSFTKAPGR